jgi:valyl-tRNA synthetase
MLIDFPTQTIINEGSAEEAQSAMETLYTALEGALRLIHPFMPFLSEELWQRLPKRPGDKTPSITIAKVCIPPSHMISREQV